MSKPTVAAMTGVGQRMPSQQAIILRPGQQNSLVTLPGGQSVRQPLVVSAAGGAIRVQGPGLPTRPNAGVNRNVVINQSGSQISVPLHALQSMQAGQGIPTGQAGHLLVKTENGQYQIVKVGPSVTSAGVASSPQVIRTVQRTATVQAPTAAPTPPRPTPASVAAAVVASSAPKTTTSSSNSNSASGGSSGSGGGGGGSGGMGGTQMTPDTAKHKCKNFLATLLKLASEQPPNVTLNVRQLIQGLIDGKVNPETFTTNLQRELNSSPQPCLVPFLKRSLPYLQQSLINGELSIDGVRAPPKNTPLAVVGMNKGVTTVVQRPQVGLRPQATTLVRTITTPGATMNSNILRTMTPKIIQQTSKPPFMMAGASAVTNRSTLGGLNTLNNVSPMMSNAAAAAASVREKKSSNSYSVTGDEDINDVAAMGGVNLFEESQRMQGGLPTGTQIRSCKDETFLLTGLLHKRVAKICLDHGLEEPPPEVIALVSHATQDRLKTLLEKLSVISEHRLDIVRQEGDYEVSQDVRGQLRFLGELDKIERRRHEEAERELLLRAAKSRTKTEDPEKEKLKAKAKELQRIEEEQVRHEKANNTALMAIGGPRKKFKLDEDGFSSAASSSAGGSGGAGGLSTSFTSRPRMKRVHVRDLMFLMEQEKELKRSHLLWKAHCA